MCFEHIHIRRIQTCKTIGATEHIWNAKTLENNGSAIKNTYIIYLLNINENLLRINNPPAEYR